MAKISRLGGVSHGDVPAVEAEAVAAAPAEPEAAGEAASAPELEPAVKPKASRSKPVG